MIRGVDLFSGCGGLSLGLEKAGIKIDRAFEAWKPAIEVYRANFDHPCIEFDLSEVNGAISEISRLKVDIIVGGPPCQDFSHAGGRSEGSRASLTRAFAEIIVGIRPRWFLMENVDRAERSDAYREAKSLWTMAGYGLTERVLDASRCGVPQRRKRFFCVGRLGCDDDLLDSAIDNSLAKRSMTVREYLGNELGVEHYYRHPRNYNRRGVFSIDEPAPTVRGVNRPVPKGYKGHSGDPVPVSGLRPLTTLERARLQTFPRTFCWNGTKTDLELMVGNAVPVNLAEFVGNLIVGYEMAGKKSRRLVAA